MSRLRNNPFVEVESYCSAFGVSWRGGKIWVAAGSSLNPSPRAPLPLALAYESTVPLPPTPEDVNVILAELEATVPEDEVGVFALEATILRAAARAFYAL